MGSDALLLRFLKFFSRPSKSSIRRNTLCDLIISFLRAGMDMIEEKIRLSFFRCSKCHSARFWNGLFRMPGKIGIRLSDDGMDFYRVRKRNTIGQFPW